MKQPGGIPPGCFTCSPQRGVCSICLRRQAGGAGGAGGDGKEDLRRDLLHRHEQHLARQQPTSIEDLVKTGVVIIGSPATVRER